MEAFELYTVGNAHRSKESTHYGVHSEELSIAILTKEYSEGTMAVLPKQTLLCAETTPHSCRKKKTLNKQTKL